MTADDENGVGELKRRLSVAVLCSKRLFDYDHPRSQAGHEPEVLKPTDRAAGALMAGIARPPV